MAGFQDAALDAAAWPRALALLADACAMHSSHLAVVDAGAAGPEYVFGLWHGGCGALEAAEREYRQRYFARDERVARLLMMPAGALLHVADLYTAREQATSATYREFLPRWGVENQMAVRLGVLDGLHLLCTATRTRGQGEWRAAHRGLLMRALPHIGGAVRVRQALAKADARAAAYARLFDEAPKLALLLDRQGRVVHVNAAARRLLTEGRGVSEREGLLAAVSPADEQGLRRLLAQAAPRPDGAPAGGILSIDAGGPQLRLRIEPVAVTEPDFGARRITVSMTG